MQEENGRRVDQLNTISMLGQAYSLLGFQIVDGVVGAGFPQKPKHSAVFAQIDPDGSRLTDLARRANMTPQAMGELVDELEELGYVSRQRDPSDRRAKLIVLTPNGWAAVEAAKQTIGDLEARIDEVLGEEGHRALRRLLTRLLDDQG
ncbi:MAG TPA: MarR family winged helix-turn-helix transcriptional regulator [Actinomycetota bacterium]|nr:MarR family winged helix-turn-helix transcriptional regulator [Actinomycetota bacterium]